MQKDFTKRQEIRSPIWLEITAMAKVKKQGMEVMAQQIFYLMVQKNLKHLYNRTVSAGKLKQLKTKTQTFKNARTFSAFVRLY